MPVCNLYNLMDYLAVDQRLMGLDVGKKTIGLALSDTGKTIASPYRILWRKKFTPDAHILINEIHEHNIGGFVIGWPLNMNGSEGTRCDQMRDFAHAFLRLYELPIYFQDERLSTKAVEQDMVAADLTRKKRTIRRDALAASWILQSALDRSKTITSEEKDSPDT